MAATKKAKAKKAPAKRKITPRKRKSAPKAKTPFLLTKPQTPEEKRKSTKLVIIGFEDTIASLRSNKKKLTKLEADYDEEKAKLIAAVTKKRLAEEKRGNFHKTCEISAEYEPGGNPALVVFQDKYSKVDIDHEKALRAGLNGHYGELVGRKFVLSVKGDTTLKALKAALGGKYAALLALVDVKEHLAINGDFMLKRSLLRGSLTNKENDACDAITAQCQHAPQVKIK